MKTICNNYISNSCNNAVMPRMMLIRNLITYFIIFRPGKNDDNNNNNIKYYNADRVLQKFNNGRPVQVIR